MREATQETPVLIAGGGPVGLTVAMSLARRDVPSIVLESRRAIPPNPRCNTTNARSMEIFRLLGCADAIRSAGLPADHSTDVVYMTDLAGEELTRFRRPTTADVRAGVQQGIGASWPTPEPQHFISQLSMEPVLRRHAVDELGVDLRLGWRLVGFEQTAGEVRAIAEDVDTGERQRISAAYLVGADGSSSLVRHEIGASLEGIPALENTTSVFFRSRRVNELFSRTPGWMYRFPGGAMLVAISEDDWLLHTQVPRGEDPATFDYEPQLFRSLGERVDYEPIGVSRWTARAMVANKFVEGRAVLAGDAAHIWVPMGGFGMNAGIGDADALGWRLAGLLQGWLDPRILLSYESERSSLGTQVAAQAPRWRAAIQPLMQEAGARVEELRAPDHAAARAAFGKRIQEANRSEWESVGLQLGFAYEGSPIVVADGERPPAFSVETYRESSVPGVRAPHLWRVDPYRSLYDDLGPGFTLLRLGPQPPSGAAVIAAAGARGIPLLVVDVPEAEAVAKYEDHGLVLVRPDQHVAWRGHDDPDDVDALLDTVTGRRIPVPRILVRSAEGLPAGPAQDAASRWRDGSSIDEAVDADGARWTLEPGRVRRAAAGSEPTETRIEPHAVALAIAPSLRRLFVRHASGAVRQARILDDGRLSRFSAFVSGPGEPAGLAVDGADEVWVCRRELDAVEHYDRAGRLIERIETPPGLQVCGFADDTSVLLLAGSTDDRSWLAGHRVAQPAASGATAGRSLAAT